MSQGGRDPQGSSIPAPGFSSGSIRIMDGSVAEEMGDGDWPQSPVVKSWNILRWTGSAGIFEYNSFLAQISQKCGRAEQLGSWMGGRKWLKNPIIKSWNILRGKGSTRIIESNSFPAQNTPKIPPAETEPADPVREACQGMFCFCGM